MKRFGTVLFLVVASCVCAYASKPCEELKSEIAKKLDDNGVKGYTLDVVAKDESPDGKEVGTCEGGTKKIVYSRDEKTAKAETPKRPTPAAKKE
jgi:hypothetical protein